MSGASRPDPEEEKAEFMGIRLSWVAFYGLTDVGVVGLLDACLGLASGNEPSVAGALYLAVGGGGFWLLLKALGR